MPRRGVGSVVVERGMDVRKKGRILICGYGMGYSYYPMKFTFLLGQRLRTQGYGIHSIVGKRSDRAELRRLAAVLKERWSLVLIMGSGAEERKLVVESGRPFALVRQWRVAGIRIPEDVAVVTHANKGLGPVWAKPLSSMEMDPTAHARAVADAVVDYLDTGVPRDLDLGSVWKNGATF